MPNGNRLYTKAECDLIREHFPDLTTLEKKIGMKRTNIRQKAYRMKDVERGRYFYWRPSECLLLRKHWRRATVSELATLFPHRSHKTLFYKAKKLGLKYRTVPMKETGDPLVDQVRKRSRSLNISMRELDIMLDLPETFSSAARRPVNANRIYKAIKLLDGSLNRDGSVTWR